jgi:MoxR-like ATPase
MTDYIQFGASPRASLALIRCAKVLACLHARSFIIPEDIQEIGEDVLQHRIILKFDALADGVSVQDVIRTVIESVDIVE